MTLFVGFGRGVVTGTQRLDLVVCGRAIEGRGTAAAQVPRKVSGGGGGSRGPRSDFTRSWLTCYSIVTRWKLVKPSWMRTWLVKVPTFEGPKTEELL